MKPAARREVVRHWRDDLGLSQRRACGLVGIYRSTFRYTPQRPRDGELRQRLREQAAQRPRYGYRRLHVLLRREGLDVNHKRIYRLYCEEGLAVRRKRRKRVAQLPRKPKPTPERRNERWSMDFMPADGTSQYACGSWREQRGNRGVRSAKLPGSCRLYALGPRFSLVTLEMRSSDSIELADAMMAIGKCVAQTPSNSPTP